MTPATALSIKIVDLINTSGNYATRILTAGIYNEEAGKWEKSGAERGTADIHACIMGIHVSIEIKHGRDSLRKKQIEVRQRIIDAGGQYIAIHDIREFEHWFTVFTSNKK